MAGSKTKTRFNDTCSDSSWIATRARTLVESRNKSYNISDHELWSHQLESHPTCVLHHTIWDVVKHDTATERKWQHERAICHQFTPHRAYVWLTVSSNCTGKCCSLLQLNGLPRRLTWDTLSLSITDDDKWKRTVVYTNTGLDNWYISCCYCYDCSVTNCRCLDQRLSAHKF